MLINSKEELFALVGKTLRHANGEERIILSIENYNAGETGDVYWKRPGGTPHKRPQTLARYFTWLDNAQLVTEAP